MVGVVGKEFSSSPLFDLFVFATEGGVEKWVFGHYFLAIP